MADITVVSRHRATKTFLNPLRNTSIKVDLTPMVDLGFLLITFFVFTTSMTEPKTLDLIEPHEGKAKPVKESDAMTIIVGKDHMIWYYFGMLKAGSSNQIIKSDLHSIRGIIVEMKRKSDPHFLMFILKSVCGSTFGDNINLLDEMSICGITPGHYAEAELSRSEMELLDGDRSCRKFTGYLSATSDYRIT